MHTKFSGIGLVLASLGILSCSDRRAEPIATSVAQALTWVEDQQIAATDGVAYANLGDAVALDRDTALIGAPGDQTRGAAYVYVLSAASWVLQQKLLASDGVAYDELGAAVALSGDTAVVGAPGSSGSGAAYVFVRSGTGWSEQQKLVAADGAGSDDLGASVSVEGDVAFAGAPYHAHAAYNAGAVYPFVRSGTVWTGQPEITASDANPNCYFGRAIAQRGGSVLVGADGASGATDAGAGAAYVFTPSGTAWSEQQKLVASDGASNESFGWAVAIDGGTALVGAYANTDFGFDSGSAYVFARSGTVWSAGPMLLPDDPADSDRFGISVAVSADRALVGALWDDDVGTDSGSTYAFERNGTTWTQAQKLVASDGAPYDTFGGAVAISGAWALIGAPQRSDPAIDVGAAYGFALRDSLGDACGTGGECASGFCAGGVCCAEACTDACATCLAAEGAPADGTCGPRTLGTGSCASPLQCNGTDLVCPTSCADDKDCVYSYHCDTASSTCVPDLPEASACTGDGQCPGGSCVDGFCCDVVCDGPCQACSAARKGAGQDGVCGTVAAGVACGTTTCAGNTVQGAICDAAGICQSGTQLDCGAYLCGATGCAASCRSAADCAADAFCSGSVCRPSIPLGEACGAAVDCPGGYCVDGVCCNDACTGQCEACDVAGSEGTCSAVTGVPRGARSACTGAEETCGGACDGTNRAACSYPSTVTTCGTPTCAAGIASHFTCDGQGACVAAPDDTCSPYLCGADSCRSDCTENAQCAAGFQCASGACAPAGNTCISDTELRGPTGAVTDCSPYLCRGLVCLPECTSASDCIAGYRCSTEGRCEARDTGGSSDDGGCGCRTAGGASGSGWGLLGILLLLAARSQRPRKVAMARARAENAAMPAGSS
jgi:hypothetical protein